jgi:transposase
MKKNDSSSGFEPLYDVFISCVLHRGNSQEFLTNIRRNTMTTVGIDVSKTHIDVCIAEGAVRRYGKTPKQYAALLKTLPFDAVCVVEATGTYHLSLVYYLHEHQRSVRVANPLTTKAFAHCDLPRAKTDTVDAKMLCAFAASGKGRLWQPPSRAAVRCRQKQTAIDHLTKNNARTKNVLESLAQYPEQCREKGVIERLEDLITVIEEQIHALHEEMRELLDEEYGTMRSHIESIPGIGRATAMKIMTFTDGLRSFTDVKQLVAFIGCCPDITTSGTSVHHATLTTFCVPTLRRDLYMCALSAKVWNAPCKEVYQKEMSKHQIHKKALIRVSNKLLRQVFAVVKQQCPYDETIGLSVQKQVVEH